MNRPTARWVRWHTAQPGRENLVARMAHDRTEVDTMSGCIKMRETVGEVVRVAYPDRVRMRKAFAQSAAIAERVPCFALDYPRDYAALPDVAAAVAAHARKEALS